MPLVSAIIPAYNYARFVGRAIDSVLAQTYSPIECLIVDDGSTDETPIALAAYGDRVKVIRQKNQGLSAARNTGIAHARGTWLAFLDADDWWEPAKIEKQVRFLQAHPECAAVGCSERNISPRVKMPEARIEKMPSGHRVRDMHAVALRELWVGGSGSGILARREVFEEIGGFDTALRAAEDWDYWLRLFARYRVGNLKDVLNNRSWHGTGTFRNAALMEENQWRVYEKAVTAWPDVFDDRMRRRMRALILADAAGEYQLAGDYVMAAQRYWDSLKTWPFHVRRMRLLFNLARLSMKNRPKESASASPRAAELVASASDSRR